MTDQEPDHRIRDQDGIKKVVFHDFPGPFMSIFHVFLGMFNRMDTEQVRFSYNTEYVTQFIIILNNRLNQV